MSLFANLAPGDIWALSGISFASAINDILDKEDFTLEELLEEDELIQEVKSKNDRLIAFLCLESTLDQLIDFIILGTSDSENEMRVYKYPYMSCEVICCEIPEILSSFVEQHEGRYLKKLFTVLSSTEKLDNYLSGYFEKILEMLFRRMTVPMMKFLNEAGTALLSDFLNHMDNYSIMQIVQRLMLPHIPFNNQADKETLPLDDVLVENSQCNWSYSNEACVLLLSKLFDDTNPDVPLHISDLLITVLQLSPPQTLVIKRLCDPECIDKLLTYSVAEGADSTNVAQPISSLASMSLASISVLESLISRLFESSLPFEQNQNIDRETENEHFAFVKVCIDGICEQFVRFVPAINQILRSYLSKTDNPCESLCNQSKVIVPRLGHRGLQLVKLIESVVRLSSSEIDRVMCSSGLFRTCIELMYFFKNNSLLHLSVQRLLITVIESDRSRSETQLFLLVNCSMVEAVMTTVSCYNVKNSSNAQNINNSADDATTLQAQQQELEQSEYYATKHSSIMGNTVLMAQAIASVMSVDMASNSLDPALNGSLRDFTNEESSFIDENGVKHTSSGAAAGAVTAGAATDDEGLFFARNEASTNPDILIGHDGSHHLTRPFHSLSMDQAGFNAATHVQSPFSLRTLINDESLLNRWDVFVDERLRPILEDQIGGNSFPAQNNIGSSFNINQDPDGITETDYYDDEDDEDEDDDDFVSNHAINGNNSDDRIEELDNDRDVWGDNYFGNDVSPDDEFYVAPDTSSPGSSKVPDNAFDFGGFANFDSFDVPSSTTDFNKTTNLADVNFSGEQQQQQPSQADLSFDAFADFPDSPSDDVFGDSANTSSSNKSGELVNADDIWGAESSRPEEHSNSVDDPFA